MNKNILMIMGGGLVIAIIVAMLVDHGLAPKGARGAKEPTVQVLAANKMLFAGQKLKAEDTYWRKWPKNLLYDGLIKKSDQKNPGKLSYYGSPLRYDIESNAPIMKGAIISGAKGNYLSAFIDPGMRAMSIRVRASTEASGFIQPGDHVDVIMSYMIRLSQTAKKLLKGAASTHHVSDIVLSDVKVLAVDQKDKSADHGAKVAQTVTLEVTPQGAEKLALAQQMGTLYLALRRLGDNKAAADHSVVASDVSQVMRHLDDYVMEYMISKKHKAASPEVRIYDGNTVQNVPVR